MAKERKHFSKKRLSTICATINVLLIFGLTALVQSFVQNLLWSYLFAVNIVTFSFYLYDKMVAGTGATRIPEAILHFSALIGGTPAALAAQHLLRHKTISPRFRAIFALIILGQISVFLIFLRFFGEEFALFTFPW